MKKVFLLSAFMALPFWASAQSLEQQVVEQEILEQQAEEQQYYMYNVVIFGGTMNNEGFDVDIDDGKEIKTLKGKDGKKIKFRTPAAVLMYFISEGWEMHLKGDSSYPNDLKMTYWVMRKPCTKAEFEKAVEEGVK